MSVLTVTQQSHPSMPVERIARGEEETEAFLWAAFGAGISGVDDGGQISARHCRWDLGEVVADDLSFSATFDYTADAVPSWRVLRARRGVLSTSVQGHNSTTGSGEVSTVQPDAAYTGRNENVDATVVGMQERLVQQALGPDVRARDVLDGHNARAASGNDVRLWDRTVDLVFRETNRHRAAGPLLVGNAQRLLVSTALELFVTDVVTPPSANRGAQPSAVRRAQEFADVHAGDDIGIAEMALAARVTPRALQYAFRKHLGTTPEGYLRSLRLDRAHADLVAADPARTTVGAIAARWGFLHRGRFAAAYRKRYRRPPRTTLLE